MLSTLIITKNEEDTIADCIRSVKNISSEIIVLDSYSDDKTTEIAEQLGAKVIQNEFDNFSAQRNFALSLAKNNWILYIDADERLTTNLEAEITKTVKEYKDGSNIGGYVIKRKTFFFNKDWGLVDKVERLFYKPLFIEWEGSVHETPKTQGKIIELKNHLIHYTHRDLSQMIKKTNVWSEYEVDLRIKTNHPKMNIARFLRVMLTGFLKSYIKEKGYKNGIEGLIESIYQSFSMFVTYAKLWEKQQKPKN